MISFLYRFSLCWLITVSIHADSLDVTKLLPDTYCKKYPQNNVDLSQAYNDYTLALQYVQAVVSAQNSADISSFNQALNAAKESMDDAYDIALNYDSTAPEYSLVVLNAVYDMLIELSTVVVTGFKPEDLKGFDFPGVRAKADAAYQAALTKIKGTTNKLIISQTVKSATATLSQLVCRKISSIETIIKYIKFTQDQQANYQKEIQALEERYKYFLRYQAFLKETTPLFGQLEKIYIDVEKFFQQYAKTKVYDQAGVTAIAQEYLNLLDGYFQAYQKNSLKIDPADRNNRLVSLLNNMINFFGRLITLQCNFYQSSKTKADLDLNTVVVRIIGTQRASDPDIVKNGYDLFIQNILKKYLPSGIEALLSTYAGQKMKALYVIALRALDSQVHFPLISADQLTYSEHLYAVLNNMIAYISGDNQVTELIHVNVSIAGIYAIRAQTILTQEMSLDNQQNSILLNAVVAAFNNAITHYKLSGQQMLVDMYQKRLDSLTQARLDQQTAQNNIASGNKDAAIDALRKAAQEFAVAGDTFDATLIQNQLVQLYGQQLIDQGKTVLANFVQKYKTQWQSYIAYIKNPTSTGSLSTYEDMLSALVQAANQALDSFTKAQAQYDAALSTNPTIAQDKSFIQNTTLLKGALDVLSSLVTAQKLMDAADQAVSFGTQDLFSRAQQQYTGAFSFYQKADSSLKNQADLSAFISIDPALMTDDKSIAWSFYSVGASHVARQLVGSLSQIADVALKLAYLNFIKTNVNASLTVDMQHYVADQIDKFAHDEATIEKLLEQAQTDYKAATALVAADWQASSGATYQSKANSLWQQVLQEYWSVYQLGKKDVLTTIIQVINQYATAYAKNVADAYNPLVGAALINYYAYVIYQVLGDTGNSSKTVTTINTALVPFLALPTQQLATLTKAMSGDPASAKIGMDTNKALNGWLAQADSFIDQQNQIIDQIGSDFSDDQKLQVKLLSKATDSQGSITYTYAPTKQSIVITNPLLLAAQVGQKLGDYFYAQKDYDSAKYAYWQAIVSYKKLGRPDDQKLDTIYNLSKARSDGYAFINYVIPGPLTTVGQFAQIPTSYKVKAYQQPIPDIVLEVALNAVGITINDIPQLTQDQLAKLVINIAKFSYLFHKISDHFSADQFQYYLQIIANHQENTLPDDQQMALVNILSDWQDFSTDLQKRIDAKESNLLLRGGQVFKNGCSGISANYALVESNACLPVIISATDYAGFYKCYPSVLQYYAAAQTILASGPQAVMGGTIYRPAGNDPDGYKAAQIGLINGYISEGYRLKQKIAQLMKSDTAVALSKIDKYDMSVNIKDYQELHDTMHNLYTNIVSTYQFPLDNVVPYMVSDDDKKTVTAKFLNLIGTTCKDWGDTSKLFLVGLPTDDKGIYFQWLNNVTIEYVTAINKYNYGNDLWNQTGQLWETAGDVLTKQNLYFNAALYYGGAALYYSKFAGDNKDTADTLRIQWKEVLMYFKGSSFFIKEYNNYKKNPIEITLSTGEKKQFTFADIFNAYNAFQNGEATADEEVLKMAGTIRNAILDSMIYYGGTSQLLNTMAGSSSSKQQSIKGAALLHVAKPLIRTNALRGSLRDDPSDNPDQTKAESLIDSFVKNNNFDLTTLNGIQAMMDRSDFPVFLENEFDQLHKNVTTDAPTKAIYYGAMGILASKLYTAFSRIYINDFYSDLSPLDAQNALSQDIQIEVQNIQTPPEQYIGG